MAIGFVREAACYACGADELNGFELHEVEEGRWEVFCVPCSLTLELNEGK